jgi:hypothetical protein
MDLLFLKLVMDFSICTEINGQNYGWQLPLNTNGHAKHHLISTTNPTVTCLIRMFTVGLVCCSQISIANQTTNQWLCHVNQMMLCMTISIQW